MTVHEPNLGNRVRVCNRADKAALDAIAAELGDNLIPFVHDVCDEAGWAKLLDMVRDKSGRLDILFNNAGIMMEPAGLLQISYADWQRQMRINTDSVFLGMKAAAPIMIETAAANGTVGSIVNTSSVYGLAGGDLIEQRIELCELLSAQACHERCGGLLACSGTASDASTLDRRDRWQQDSRLPQACNNAGGDDQAFVGRPGGLCCGFDH